MAYKFGIVNGAPYFTPVGQTNISISFAGRGAPRVTSLNGQPGTGIVSMPLYIQTSSSFPFQRKLILILGLDRRYRSGHPGLSRHT